MVIGFKGFWQRWRPKFDKIALQRWPSFNLRVSCWWIRVPDLGATFHGVLKCQGSSIKIIWGQHYPHHFDFQVHFFWCWATSSVGSRWARRQWPRRAPSSLKVSSLTFTTSSHHHLRFSFFSEIQLSIHHFFFCSGTADYVVDLLCGCGCRSVDRSDPGPENGSNSEWFL